MLRRRPSRRLAFLGALTLLALPSCTTRPVEAPRGGAAEMPGFAPALVVERFLSAANAVAQASDGSSADRERVRGELDTMARLFGTRDGSVLRRDNRADVEQRMYTIASLLRHDDYTLQGERVVPGRSSEAVELLVRLRRSDRERVVPFTLVRTKDDSWLVEQVSLNTPTQSR